jgi:hypothetical protein
MKARGAAWILGGVLVALAALIALVSMHGGGADAAITARSSAALASSPDSIASVDRDGIATNDLATIASPRERVSTESNAFTSSAPKRLRFHYPDGTPAAGLQLYRADWRSEQFERGLAHDRPQWLHSLDAHGEIDAASTRDLGAIVAVRLSPDCVEIFPLDASRADYELTPMVEQEFALANAPIGRELTVEVHIGNEDFRRCHGSFDCRVHRVEAFADEVSARIWNDEHLVIAYRRMKVTSSRPVVMKLPRGEYWVECANSTVGAWMNATSATVDGTPIRLPLTSVPVTQALLKRDEKGELRVPDRITVSAITEPDRDVPKGSIRIHVDSDLGSPPRVNETALDFEVDGDRLLINERWRDALARDAKYALRFYWPDGTMTTTAPGQWENLLDTLALCGQ